MSIDKVEILQRKGYKKTKLGWIPEEWGVEKLGDLSLVKGQYGVNEAAVDYNPNLPAYIRITDITEEGWFDERKRKSVKIKETEDYTLEVNDIVFARTGATVGRTYLHQKINMPLIFAGFLIRFRVNQNRLLSLFLKYYTQSSNYWRWVKIYSLRSGQPGINGKEYSSLPVYLPPIQEQKAIANCLSTWDRAIEKQSQLIQAKQTQKKALMQQLLTGKKRLLGFTEEWEEYSYGDLLITVNRPVDWNDSEKYELISVRRRSGGLFHRDSLFGNEILTKKLFTAKKGDFLISKMQILHGASGLVTEEFDGMKISGSYIAVVPKDNSILSTFFLEWYSKVPYFYHQTYRSSYGVHIEKMTFSYKLFLKEKILLPSITEQIAIANILNTANKEIALLQQQLQQLQQQKKGLMQQLLTGKKRLKY
ncbi:restriction endonuclease subunit S [Tenacibaculum xiamenense]|uniref:restriction endonuclease subunit S n=1 Tax=Tenacibaculum xiamenense TaxID=1261553 RepID=UPI00389541A9